jgi:hypothetical protein
MTDLKIDDKIKIRKYNSKKDYDEAGQGDGWTYEYYLEKYNKAKNIIFEITDIIDKEYIEIKPNIMPNIIGSVFGFSSYKGRLSIKQN